MSVCPLLRERAAADEHLARSGHKCVRFGVFYPQAKIV